MCHAASYIHEYNCNIISCMNYVHLTVLYSSLIEKSFSKPSTPPPKLSFKELDELYKQRSQDNKAIKKMKITVPQTMLVSIIYIYIYYDCDYFLHNMALNNLFNNIIIGNSWCNDL